MKRAALAMALVAASSGVAAAGGYVGLGVGTAPAFSDDLNATRDGSGRSLRGILGYRIGAFAIEGAYSGFDVGSFNGDAYEVRQASIAGKYNLALGDGFSAFGKLGLHWMSMDHGEGDPDGLPADGTGWLLGGGFEYTFKLAATSASVFVDYQYSKADLENRVEQTHEISTRVWTLGVTIGF